MGGLHEFMGWRGAIITDSGGFQVFSMGHGSVAEEIKRRRDRRESMIVSIEEEGVRFRSYLDGRERFMGPETSMEVQAALGSDIALAFDECTPFHVERDYTRARWSAPTAGSTAASPGAASTRRPGSSSTGSCRAASTRTCGRSRPTTWPSRGWPASRSAARSARRRSRCARWWAGRSRGSPTSRRATCSGSATSTTSSTRWASASTRFDCATPTRLARHGTALVPDPESRWRLDLDEGPVPHEPRADRRGLPVPGLPRAHARLPALPPARRRADRRRLLTLHNLTFMQRLMSGMREAIEAGRYGDYARAVLAGEAP